MYKIKIDLIDLMSLHETNFREISKHLEDEEIFWLNMIILGQINDLL